jgi:hypothetical protein
MVYFRVHSHFFREFSGYWRSYMAGAISPGDNRRPPGFHESTAFLIDLDPQDFALFLFVFYNPFVDLSPAYKPQGSRLIQAPGNMICIT